jgi:phasin
MTEVTAGATKAKTAKYATSPSGLPSYEIPKFDLPNMEMPEAFREMTEKGIAHAKDTYEKAKAAAEQATDLLKNSYATAAKGATDYNLRVLEIARTNTGTALDYAHDLLGVKSLPEFIELSTAHARKQFEAMTAQTKELTEHAVKLTTEVAEPLKTGVTKAFGSQAARS